MTKRCREEIMLLILDICRIDTTKSAIACRAGSNLTNIETYLGILIKNKLVVQYEKKYRTTSRGLEMLSDLKHIQSNLVAF